MSVIERCSGSNVVFVFGALRSGTTVFRLMLDGHPQIRNPGEVDFLFDFLSPDPSHPTGWRYDIAQLSVNRIFQASKLTLCRGKDGLDLLADFIGQYQARGDGVLTLNIHRNIGRASQVLPEARIIHMLRDPRDVARSSIGMGWAGNLYFGVDHWIKTEMEWHDMAFAPDDPRVLTLKYETLFRRIEEELRRVCKFLGVPFQQAMLEYHLNSTYSPPDVSLVEQWRRKSTLDEVALVEGKTAPLMQALGYEMASAGRQPTHLERGRLKVGNRLAIWATGIKRHGFGTYVLEKISRYCRMEKLNDQMTARMRSSMSRYVK